MIPQIDKYSYIFPNPLFASSEGIVGYGGDLGANRVMSAYTQGIFPWFNEDDPILWWCPDPRFILKLEDLHISKNLKKLIKKDIFEIRFDTAFLDVIQKCSKAFRKDQNGTWITQDMIDTYVELYRMGFAHSFEAWSNDKLVGGGYGIVVGDIFCGESMFSDISGASKVAFVKLVERLKKNRFSLIDSQIYTPYLESFGSVHISRQEYLDFVKDALNKPRDF